MCCFGFQGGQRCWSWKVGLLSALCLLKHRLDPKDSTRASLLTIACADDLPLKYSLPHARPFHTRLHYDTCYNFRMWPRTQPHQPAKQSGLNPGTPHAILPATSEVYARIQSTEALTRNQLTILLFKRSKPMSFLTQSAYISIRTLSTRLQ